MSVTVEEIAILRNRLVSRHGIELFRIATMVEFFGQMTPEVGNKAEHVKVLHSLVNERLKAMNVSRSQFVDLLVDLDRTYATISFINSIPE